MSHDHPLPVLVVEDEIFIRMVAVDSLEDRGYSILEAADAEEAIALLETNSAISLLFTDINMPGDTDGLGLAAEVARRWPHIEIIVTSGAVNMVDDDIPDSGRFLPKPYTAENLERLIQEQLTHASERPAGK